VLRTPYSKDFLHVMAPMLNPVHAADAGYAVLLQDVRGQHASDGGPFFPLRGEADDGYDTVEWAAAQPWSDGAVGHYGLSYMGATTWLSARHAPPSLRAIAPAQAPGEWASHLFWRNGVLELGALVRWAVWAIAPGDLVRHLPPTELPSAFAELVDTNDRYDDLVRHLPVRALPGAGKDGAPPLTWLRDALLPPSELTAPGPGMPATYEDVTVPALIIGGWHDILLHSDLDHYRKMRETGGSESARNQTKLVIGPWWHGMFKSTAGPMDYGFRALGMFDLAPDLPSHTLWGDFTWFTLRWFDHWLKGDANGVEEDPRVRYFVQGRNTWATADDWPPPGATEQRIYLQPDGGLDAAVPAADAPTTGYVYDPSDPAPTVGGRLLMTDLSPKGPVEQSTLLHREDVRTYTSAPLAEPLEIAGQVRAILYAATSAPDTDWVVKLCDRYPDGRVFNVTEGIIRARYRDGAHPSPDLAGEVVRYEIALDDTAMRFPAGHQLVVLVTSSNFPRHDRNPNTGAVPVKETELRTARQTIFHDGMRPSHLVLPVMDR
jgi:putative CocE/NonD family hydrolase